MTPGGVEREREKRGTTRGVRFGHVPIFWVPHFLFKNRRPTHGQWIVCSWFNCTFSFPFSLFFRWRLHFPTLWEVYYIGRPFFIQCRNCTDDDDTRARCQANRKEKKKEPSAVVNFFCSFPCGSTIFWGENFWSFWTEPKRRSSCQLQSFLMEGNLIWIGMMWSLCSVFTHAGLIFSWMHSESERESQFRVWRNESSARSALVIISIPIKHIITTLTNSRSVSQVARGQQHRNGRNFQIKILFFFLYSCVFVFSPPLSFRHNLVRNIIRRRKQKITCENVILPRVILNYSCCCCCGSGRDEMLLCSPLVPFFFFFSSFHFLFRSATVSRRERAAVHCFVRVCRSMLRFRVVTNPK